MTACAKSAFSERNPYPGWMALAPDFARRVEQLGEVEVGLGGGLAAERERLVGEPDVWRVGVGFGVHGHAREPGVLGRADHPDSDLTAIGYQHLRDA